jgi:hypothetical protein
MIWLVLGVVSIVILYNSILKKSTREKIPIDQIKVESVSGFFRKKKIFYRIKERKNRDLLSKIRIRIYQIAYDVYKKILQ